MLTVASISLGSSRRDSRAETTLLGERVLLRRVGVDGDRALMRRLFLELDGSVDAFGFGGADLGFAVNGRYYPLHSVAGLAAGLHTPVVDGGALRAVIERRCAARLDAALPGLAPRRVLIATGAARYDLARGFADAGYELLLGDMGFALGLPVALHSLSALDRLARMLMPAMMRLPFDWLYPTGERQDEITPRFGAWYAWATVWADDFHYLKRHLPDRLDGKVIVTNSTTAADVEMLRARGLRTLVTTTPRIEGRSFGTNVIEAALTAIAGRGRPLTPGEIEAMLKPEDLPPCVTPLNP
jgi:hypothetical protein